LVTNTHLVNPHPDDPIDQLAVASNARTALLGGGAYLRERLAAEPAAPADLAKAVNSMAKTIEQLSINYLAVQPISSRIRRETISIRRLNKRRNSMLLNRAVRGASRLG
jgi:hypothetical protein